MADLKELQAMAKNGEVSKKLLENEEFKSELKKMLKEENGVEITDEQIPEIIKKFESTLQNEEILKEAELDNISGGKNDELNEAKVKAVGTAVGAVLGAIGGVGLGMAVYDDSLKKINKEEKNLRKVRKHNRKLDRIYGEKLYHVPEELEADADIHILGKAGAAVGAGVGLGVAHLFCKALDLDRLEK